MKVIFEKGANMKYLVAAVLLSLATAVFSFDTKEKNNEANSKNGPNLKYTDILINKSLSSSFESLREDRATFKVLVEALASNQKRTNEGKPLVQSETNQLIKAFIDLDLRPNDLTSFELTGHLKIYPLKDRVQVIQTLKNIADTKDEMESYLSLDDVRCSFRNYENSDAPLELLRSEDVVKNSSMEFLFPASDDVSIVGVCRGCGLMGLPEFKVNADQEKYCSSRK